MSAFRRAKLALDALRISAASLRPAIPGPAPKIHLNNYNGRSYASIPANSSASLNSVLGRNLGFRFHPNHNSPLSGAGSAKRFYSSSNRKPQSGERWYFNPRKILIVGAVTYGLGYTVVNGSYEAVPYTKRNHFVLITREDEVKMGEKHFKQLKSESRSRIRTPTHPDSVRVRKISGDIIKALKRGVNSKPEEGELLKEGDAAAVDGEDKRILKNRKKGRKAQTSHIDGLKWEVVVVNKPDVNAYCYPGGKIVVFTGLLEHFKTDAEIATIIGHEVGHAVARHSAETFFKNVWTVVVKVVLAQLDISPDVLNQLSNFFFTLPFSRKLEKEADYIGLLLMASAGYDPRGAPAVYEKLGKLSKDSAMASYFSTHPAGEKRAQLLTQAHVMEEALALYKETQAGRGTEGFFL